MKNIESLRKEFIKSERYMFCSSQRCTKEDEWLNGCSEWKAYLKQHSNIRKAKDANKNCRMSILSAY